MDMATQLNAHLATRGNIVQVTTYTRSTVYTWRHAGWFSMVGDNLYVKHGRSRVQLSMGDRLLVGIRTGRTA